MIYAQGSFLDNGDVSVNNPKFPLSGSFSFFWSIMKVRSALNVYSLIENWYFM